MVALNHKLYSMAKNDFSFEKGIKEVESILKQLNQGDIGIDILQDKVGKAKEILNKCRDKLRDTEKEIEEMLE